MRTLGLLLLLALFTVCAIIVWLAQPRRRVVAQPGSYKWMWERIALDM